MIVLYTPEISSRITYSCNLIFKEVLGVEYSITNNIDTFLSFHGIRLNYSKTELGNSILIYPSGLLTETNISEWNPRSGYWEELPVIFANPDQNIPFDIFSAVFYLITRYEEHLPYKPDEYGRYAPENSVSFKNNFLRLPVIDLWCRKLVRKLSVYKDCPNIQTSNYRFQLTIDIDQPWLYKNKGVVYAVGSLVRELIHANLIGFKERFNVLTGQCPDPADTYELLSGIQKRLSDSIRYFLLCRNAGEYDNNRSVHRKSFHDLAKDLDRTNRVGIHPSYGSNQSSRLLSQEISYLSGVLNRDITSSRQHFLKLTFPDTYRNLINFGIKEDYSMGYGSLTGFRAGISRAFNFFDLPMNQETTMRIVPFQIMDRTLLSYMKLSAEEAIEEFTYYTEMIRKVGGEFVCLWHNEGLSDKDEWKGWRNVFLHVIDMNSSR
jgi:hypothetical protein